MAFRAKFCLRSLPSTRHSTYSFTK